jgi:hypothetical protein
MRVLGPREEAPGPPTQPRRERRPEHRGWPGHLRAALSSAPAAPRTPPAPLRAGGGPASASRARRASRGRRSASWPEGGRGSRSRRLRPARGPGPGGPGCGRREARSPPCRAAAAGAEGDSPRRRVKVGLHLPRDVRERRCDQLERLPSPPGRRAEDERRTDPLAIKVLGDPGGGAPPAGRKRPLVIDEDGVVPARLGVAEEVENLHGPSLGGRHTGPGAPPSPRMLTWSSPSCDATPRSRRSPRAAARGSSVAADRGARMPRRPRSATLDLHRAGGTPARAS